MKPSKTRCVHDICMKFSALEDMPSSYAPTKSYWNAAYERDYIAVLRDLFLS